MFLILESIISGPKIFPLSWRLLLGLSWAILSFALAKGQATEPGRDLSANYSHRSWSRAEGLPETHVTALRQTHDGFLWIGTRRGLARFDGREFKLFTRTEFPQLDPDEIRDLVEDRDGRLWASTPRALFCWDGRTLRFSPRPEQLPESIRHPAQKQALQDKPARAPLAFQTGERHRSVLEKRILPRQTGKPGKIPVVGEQFCPTLDRIGGKNRVGQDRADRHRRRHEIHHPREVASGGVSVRTWGRSSQPSTTLRASASPTFAGPRREFVATRTNPKATSKGRPINSSPFSTPSHHCLAMSCCGMSGF